MGKRRSFEQVKEAFNNSLYYNLLGMKVTEIMEGKSKIQMSFRQNLTHIDGFVDGGAIASLANSSVAMALLSLTEYGAKGL